MLTETNLAYRSLLAGNFEFAEDVAVGIAEPLDRAPAVTPAAAGTERPNCGTVQTNDCTCKPICIEMRALEGADRLA